MLGNPRRPPLPLPTAAARHQAGIQAPGDHSAWPLGHLRQPGRDPRSQPPVRDPMAGGGGWMRWLLWAPPQDSGTVAHNAGLLPRSVGLCLRATCGKAPHAVSLPASRRAGRAIAFMYCCRLKHKAGGEGAQCGFDAHKGTSLPAPCSPAPRWRGAWSGLSVGEPAALPCFKPLICRQAGSEREEYY